MDSLLRIKISNQYNLFHKQRMTFQEIKTISENENIELEDMYKLLEISEATKSKFRKNINCGCYITIYSKHELETIKNEITDEILNNEILLEIFKQKHKITDRGIREIQKNRKSKSKMRLNLDLKYIYGRMFVNKKGMNEITNIYYTNEDEIFKSLTRSKKIYEIYKEALENNDEGVYISANNRISNKFIEENHNKLEKYLDIKSDIKSKIYNCNSMKEDLKSEAFEKIIKNGGVFEKNMRNTNRIIYYLVNMGQGQMNNYLNKMPKEKSLIYMYNGIEREIEIEDNTYNPEDWIINKEEGKLYE